MNDTIPPPNNKPRWPHWPLFCGVSAFVLIADLASKWWVFRGAEESLEAGSGLWLHLLQLQWRDVSWVIPQINPGAAWSIGSNTPWLIIALTIVLVPGLIAYYWFAIRPAGKTLEHLGFAMIIGGALGNAWDRLYSALPNSGYGGVRDFIHWDLNLIGIPYVWPTFNIADSGITGGLVAVILAAVLGARRPAPPPTSSNETSSAPSHTPPPPTQ